MIRPALGLGVLLLLPTGALAEPWMVAWTQACIADGATIYAGGLRVLPPQERRHSEPVAYCLDRAGALCRHAEDPEACRAELEALRGTNPG